MPDDRSALERGMEAMERGDWAEAQPFFKRAVEEEPSGQAYEGLSWTHWSLNEPEELLAAREASYRLYRQEGDNRGAARMAMWLGSDYIDFRGEVAVASGWRQRARRLLEGEPAASEHCWLLLMEGDASMLIGDDAPKARELGKQAAELAREVGDVDVEVIGIALQGIAMVTVGEVDEGMLLLDEAAASALSGEMSDPGYISWAICYLIYACERVRDFDRAVEWCERLREYSERSGMAVIRGICRVHLAGVFIWRGNWQEAEDELSSAWKLLENRPWPQADGTVRLADLRYRQGRLEESAALFREVEWHPLALLGLAELSLEEGRPRDAQELLERLLRQVPETSRTQRAAAQELLVRVHALQGNHKRAQEALDEVRALSATVATLPLRAALSFSAGALASADKDYDEARACFEDAAALYQRCGAPYETARARLELASTLVMLERFDRAKAEASSAHETLVGLSSVRHAARSATLLQDIERRTGVAPAAGDSSRLTERQIEILRLISRGLNDREIAEALVVSEHTVHRHVANILQRLELPSRSAAVAYAGAQGIL